VVNPQAKGDDLRDITVYGIPIGTTIFTNHFLWTEASQIEENVTIPGLRMSLPQIMVPGILGRQYMWLLNLHCLQHMGNYWTRHLPTDTTTAFWAKVNVAIIDMVKLAT